LWYKVRSREDREEDVMKAVLVHGMGRTPASFTVLAVRLRARGFRLSFFGYSAAFERFAPCVERLVARVRSRAGDDPYILIGHSLGTVLIRAVLPELAANLPVACFFLAPPGTASRAATWLAGRRLFRLLTGEMGQRLADPAFMASLPAPAVPTRIYAGTAGPRGRRFPFGLQQNDGILAVSETQLPGREPPVLVPAIHTFIMNSASVADDIVSTVRALAAQPAPRMAEPAARDR
jgi:pimeloyl-ACP methyl ester carboxylesterase